MRKSLFLALAFGMWIAPELEAQTTPDGLVLRKRHKRAIDFWKKRVFPGETIPDGALQRALGQAAAQQPRIPATPGGPNERWVNIGPTQVYSPDLQPSGGGYSGRISCLTVNPLDVNHWLAGPGIGGVWETYDAGATWEPLTDFEANLAMGAIAFAKSDTNTVYVGTGEGHGSNSYPGEGLLKTIDGGRTWTLMATNDFAKASFSEIRVSPTDKNLLYATTLPPGNANGTIRTPAAPATGFYRSTDGGLNWTRTRDGHATDIEIDPGDFTGVLMAMGNSEGDAANNDVYRSEDSGQTWTKLAGPWVGTAAGRIEMALAPSDANVLYVSVHDATKLKDNFVGVWKTANIWDVTPSWTQLSQIPAPLGDQWDYDHDLIVHPTDANMVFLGGIAVFRLDGANWTPIGGHYDEQNNSLFIHPDQQAFAWAGTRLLVGNDGGVYSTVDNGANWLPHNTSLRTIQTYHGSVHPTRPNHAIIGAQDNSCSYWRGTNAVWQEAAVGDGADSAYSRQNPDTKWLVSVQELAIARTTDGGRTVASITGGLPTTGAPFVGRIAVSPANEDIALAGHARLYRCNDTFSGTTPTWILNGPATSGTVSAIAFDPADNTGNTYAFGTGEGELQLTTDGGSTWRDIANPDDLPNRYVNNLAFHPTTPNVLHVVYSGFNDATPNRPGHVFRTADVRATTPAWSNIGPAVNIPHNALAIDPNDPDVHYLGNDLGVWRSLNSGASWTQLGRTFNLPNVPVFDIEINTIGRVVAFTHGRSAYALVDDNDRRLVTTQEADKLVVSFSALTLYPELQVTTSLSGTPTWFVANGALQLNGRNYYSTNAVSGNAQFFRLATE